MKVCYDNIRDIVSIYFEETVEVEENISLNQEENSQLESNVYDSEKAANLILDTVDIIENGSVVGFRVYNASKYYDKQLLSAADIEEIPPSDESLRPLEKVIAVVSKEGVLN